MAGLGRPCGGCAWLVLDDGLVGFVPVVGWVARCARIGGVFAGLSLSGEVAVWRGRVVVLAEVEALVRGGVAGAPYDSARVLVPLRVLGVSSSGGELRGGLNDVGRQCEPEEVDSVFCELELLWVQDHPVVAAGVEEVAGPVEVVGDGVIVEERVVDVEPLAVHVHQ